MLGQMELPYLVFYEYETEGDCRFCHEKTRDAVYPPEIMDEIHTPVFVCSACREIHWKVESLRKMFNRSIVETFIHRSEIPVVPQDLQLNTTSLSPTWNTGIAALRVFVYFYHGQTRFLTMDYNETLRSYRDITDEVKDLLLWVPELDETVLDGNIHDTEGPLRIVIVDCLKFRGLDIRGINESVREKALDKIFEIIGTDRNWRRMDP